MADALDRNCADLYTKTCHSLQQTCNAAKASCWPIICSLLEDIEVCIICTQPASVEDYAEYSEVQLSALWRTGKEHLRNNRQSIDNRLIDFIVNRQINVITAIINVDQRCSSYGIRPINHEVKQKIGMSNQQWVERPCVYNHRSI